MQKHVNLVDLVKSFPTNIFLQNLASIQKRTSPIKFAHLAEKSEKGSISNLSTKVRAGINTESGRTYIEDCEDGTYRVICMCTKPGAVELHISVDGNPLKNSPFGIALTPGPAVPRMSVLRGDLQTLGRGQVIKDTNE